MLRRTMMAGQTAPPPTGYRYWRVYITANNGSTQYTNIGEIQLRATVGGASLIPAQSSNTSQILYSSQLSSNQAWRALDGAVTGDPWITAVNQAVPSYIGWDFGSAQTVAQFGVGVSTLSVSNRSPVNFQLEGSNDNAAYTTVRSVTGATFSGNNLSLYTVP